MLERFGGKSDSFQVDGINGNANGRAGKINGKEKGRREALRGPRRIRGQCNRPRQESSSKNQEEFFSFSRSKALRPFLRRVRPPSYLTTTTTK